MWTRLVAPSLLDTIDRHPVDWFLVYSDMDDQKSWAAKFLKRGFQHVLALRRDGAIWVALHPHYSFTDVQIIRNDLTPWQMYPGCAIQHVNAMRENAFNTGGFHIGPLTCVTLMKSLLGIRDMFMLTPWELFQYCRRVYG